MKKKFELDQMDTILEIARVKVTNKRENHNLIDHLITQRNVINNLLDNSDQLNCLLDEDLSKCLSKIDNKIIELVV